MSLMKALILNDIEAYVEEHSYGPRRGRRHHRGGRRGHHRRFR